MNIEAESGIRILKLLFVDSTRHSFPSRIACGRTGADARFRGFAARRMMKPPIIFAALAVALLAPPAAAAISTPPTSSTSSNGSKRSFLQELPLASVVATADQSLEDASEAGTKAARASTTVAAVLKVGQNMRELAADVKLAERHIPSPIPAKFSRVITERNTR